MEESNTLDLLLEQAGKYHPLYGGGLATHISMVMIALDRLNAPSSKLESIFSESINKLERIGSLDSITAVECVEDDLGDTTKFSSYLKYFKGELEAYGAQAVLRKSLPILIPGVAASAFHALIRLAYAIEANSQSEIAIALAYWCAEFQPLELSKEVTDETLEDILTKLAPLGVKHVFSPGIIVNRMSDISELLKREACIIQPSSIDLPSLRSFSLKAFYANDDFTLLHTVTGCHAFSIVMPYLENVDAALAELWKAILVAYLSTGLNYTGTEITPLEGDFDFGPIIGKALASSDFHVIKLVYTCFCEYMVFKDPVYYLVAKRAVRS